MTDEQEYDEGSQIPQAVIDETAGEFPDNSSGS